MSMTSSFTYGTVPLRCFIGTYTNPNGSRGIYTSRFNTEHGTLETPRFIAECDNPTFLILHPSKPYLYAIGKFPTGMLRAFHYNKQNGCLVQFDEQGVPGHGPCHLELCPSENGQNDVVVVANYGSGNIVSFPLLADGTIGKVASDIAHTGSGPKIARQESPHVHGVYFDGSTVAVIDLGIDQVIYYNIDFTTAKLSRSNDHAPLQLPAGAGPRHLAVSHDQRFVYVVNELNSTVSVFDRQIPQNPDCIQDISTLTVRKDAAELNNMPAEIELHPSGRFLYVSNRGDDSIAVFVVDKGKLMLIQNVHSGGTTPRFFCLDPTGNFLLACNQDSGNICVFAIDHETGTLIQTDLRVKVPKPACLIFVKELFYNPVTSYCKSRCSKEKIRHC